MRLVAKVFHGCHARKEIMASKRWHLWDCLAFFCKVRTSMFLSIDKFISWQRLVSVFPCFIICGQREVCLTLGSVLVPRRKCACPSDKDLLVQIKFLLVPGNRTEVLSDCDPAVKHVFSFSNVSATS